MTDSVKSKRRAAKSAEQSAGDRRAGSVGERPELAGSRDSVDRTIEADNQDDEEPAAS